MAVLANHLKHIATKKYMHNIINCSTCIQIPRFFPEKKTSGLEWGSNPYTHISGVMLYQLSYQALGNKVVGRKGIQVLVLGAHFLIIICVTCERVHTQYTGQSDISDTCCPV